MTDSTDAAFCNGHAAALCELGVLGVESGGHFAAVRGPRAPVLLAALALAGHHGVATDELIEMIWPSPDQPPTARQSLANIVLRLRRSNGASFVASTPRGYRIGDHVQSDRRRFLADVERAGELVAHAPDRALDLIDQALARWRSEPWSGIERPVAIEADRAHLLQMHASALRLRATALVALNRPESALPALREVLVADPFDESSRYRLVRLLTDTGQRAEAVGTIHEARRLFSKRGLVLDAALDDVEQQLLSAEFMVDSEMEPLPEQPTDFVGRDRESEEIAGGLRVSRLVTLHGIGGSGKTRLAVHVASELSRPGERGFVDLAGARSHGQVELVFARGLGLPCNRLDGLGTDERREALADAASASAGLLVVDNCEHVVRDVRAVVGGLLARPGQLRILATSRVPLEITGEYRYPLPEFTHGTELFRRRSAHHGVPIDPDQHAEIIADICELVDQLPLAIEIAAAQTPYRTVHEIADELGRGIDHRDATQPEPRHETMSAAIRWSHELLDAEAADALARLGVFGAAFQQDDAAAVLTTADVRGVLDTLVRSSLVERNDQGGRSIYRLAAPVQQYCASELERTGATTEVAIALAEWLLEFTDRSYGAVWWRLSVIDEVTLRLPDALSAADALRMVGRTDDATRLASRLGGAAHLHGQADELLEILTELWPNCSDTEAAAEALVALVMCADAARRHEMVPDAIGLLAAIDGPGGRRHRVVVHCTNALWTMWTARLTDADYQAAGNELELARRLEEGLDSPIDRAHIEMWQSAIHLLAGDWPAAESAARQSLADSAGTKFDVYATSCLCHAKLQLADPDLALDLATGHPDRNRDTTFGNLLGTAAAIARVQRGDTDLGMAEISGIQHRARQARFTVHQDDAAIAIAYIAHFLGHHDLAVQILETGVGGYGPWIGYLVPKMCRDLGIPVTGHHSRTDAERRSRSDYYGTTASRVLNELARRRAKHGARLSHEM